MINTEILQDIYTDHDLCGTQRRELVKVIAMIKQNRLKELPCAVGDTVWTIAKNYTKCENHYDCEYYDSDEYLITWCEKHCPNGYQGTGVIQGTVASLELYEERILINISTGNHYLRMPVTNVFLTKEEAEAKLAELKGE